MGHAAAARRVRVALDGRPAGTRLAPLPLRVVVVLVSTVAIFGTYRTLNGIEAGTAFLVLMAAAKLLETRTSRDLTVIVFIGWFLLYAALLREQSLTQLPWLLGSTFLTAVALMRVHASSAQAPAGHIVRRTLRLLLLAAPLALLLFLLFPRLPGRSGASIRAPRPGRVSMTR